MRLPKTLDRIVKTLALGGALLTAPLQRAVADAYAGIDFSGKFNMVNSSQLIPSDLSHTLHTPQLGAFSGIPEYIRDVPAHPDDDFAKEENVAPIKDDTFPIYLFDISGLKVRPKAGLNGKVLDLCIGAEFEVMPPESTSAKIVERNYTNHPGTDERGYGAALTYYSIKQNLSSFSLGLFSRLSCKIFEVPKDSEFMPGTLNLFADYSVSAFRETFDVENGWDRYDSFEVNEEYKLIEYFLEHNIKAGINFTIRVTGKHEHMNLGLFAGANIYQVMQADVPIALFPPRFTAGIDFNVGLETKTR